MSSSSATDRVIFTKVHFALTKVLILVFTSVGRGGVVLPSQRLLGCTVPIYLTRAIKRCFFFCVKITRASKIGNKVVAKLKGFVTVLLSYLIFQGRQVADEGVTKYILKFTNIMMVGLVKGSLSVNFRLVKRKFVLVTRLSCKVSAILVGLFSGGMSPIMLDKARFAVNKVILALVKLKVNKHLKGMATNNLTVVFCLTLISTITCAL